MLIALIISLALMLGAVVAAVWFYANWRNVRQSRDEISTDRRQLESINEQHLAKLDQQSLALGEQRSQLQLAAQREGQLQSEVQAVRQQSESRLTELRDQAAAREKELRESFEQAQKQARDTFDALAGKALRNSNEEFLKLAKQVFGAEQEKAGKQLDANKLAVEGIIKPVKDSLEQYQKSLLEAEKSRVQAYGSLKQQAEAMAQGHQQLQTETANLVKALRKPHVRGSWGEMVLERVLEISGLEEGVAYRRQVHIAQEDGAIRPDVIVYLPTERFVVIDAKAPMSAYLDAAQTDVETDRDNFLDRHVKQLTKHVGDLSTKRYAEAVAKEYGRTADFVVMFLPSEAFLQAAVSRQPSILEDAISKGVVIATPTILLVLLKTVAMGWHEKSLTENAERIAVLGKDLHERLANVLGYVVALGTRIESTVNQYNEMVRSIDGRLMPKAREFHDLKAESTKAMPAKVAPVNITPRLLIAPEAAGAPADPAEQET